MSRLAPSILSADFSKLGEEISTIEKAGADIIHVDVMDGHFVPNISYGAVVMKSLLGKTKMPFDVHLMIENVDRYIDEFVTENTEYITVHQEVCMHLHRTIDHIKSKGIKAGVSINPATPISSLENILEYVDLVLVMSVNPGFGGQKFIESSLEKIRKLKRIREENRYNFVIEVDGGVNLENGRKLVKAGADILVAGSSVFAADDVVKRVEKFKEMLNGN
ncbi:MAG: ribulose-phosphate 3-epimerase [[Eubacterium] brachy]|mgnify:FL=1|jgi:ribulose-phosphate 3-epimerase|nr:ribulose-phosphate 3-epimerase [Eubacterium brachy ATCC 33089]MBF1134748.1 ribulose-phosphate 3-epimerase [[Eubacterium] brachy]